MISKQAIYLSADRKSAVPEGHEDARILLVRGGHEINDAELEKYDGAVDLAASESKAKPEAEPVIPPPNLKKFGEGEATAESEQEPEAPAKPPKKKRGRK